MKRPVSDIAFTPTVKGIQERLGSRRGYSAMENRGGWNDVISQDLAEFISRQDTLFLGTSNAEGQPYIQHRGGPPGFLKVLDEKSLAFADFRGNRQYISMGNLQDNDKAFIFLIDFANRVRFKVWGTAKVVEGDAELEKQVSDPDYDAKVERVFVFTVDAWDINCPQHIKPRFTAEEVEATVGKLRDRIKELEESVRGCHPAG
jgi:predicted pyridoxine 5'-phosphate oxidase superfamily flavin-nucleotide-binding protein